MLRVLKCACIVRALCVHCACTVRALCVHCACIVRDVCHVLCGVHVQAPPFEHLVEWLANDICNGPKVVSDDIRNNMHIIRPMPVPDEDMPLLKSDIRRQLYEELFVRTSAHSMEKLLNGEARLSMGGSMRLKAHCMMVSTALKLIEAHPLHWLEPRQRGSRPAADDGGGSRAARPSRGLGGVGR